VSEEQTAMDGGLAAQTAWKEATGSCRQEGQILPWEEKFIINRKIIYKLIII